MHSPVERLSALLQSRAMLLSTGRSERTIAHAVRAGELHQLRRGWFVPSDEWRTLWPEERHLAHLIAVDHDAEGSAVASYTAAAVLHGLPMYRVNLRRVHLTTNSPRRISSGVDVMRHKQPLASHDIAVIDGIRCTTLERTVYDLIRTLPEEAALSVADAAERKRALSGREIDPDARDAWRHDLRRRILRGAGARGIRRARFIADFADGRAQLPGESVSRLQLWRLGFATPRLQVEVPGPSGRLFFVDFGLDDVNAFGEFDGETKYRDEAMRRGMSIEDVLLEEKQREDWIRGTTQRPFARWGFPHIRTSYELGRRLAAFGISAP